LSELVDKTNTASGVWADTAYRSKKNQAWMAKNGLVSHIHTKKPKGRAMSVRASKANGKRSRVGALVEHVSLPARKGRWGCAFVGSAWPISSTTCSASSGFRGELRRHEAGSCDQRRRRPQNTPKPRRQNPPHQKNGHGVIIIPESPVNRSVRLCCRFGTRYSLLLY